jgi:hypothetical protein
LVGVLLKVGVGGELDIKTGAGGFDKFGGREKAAAGIAG